MRLIPSFIVLTLTLTSGVSRRIAEKDIFYPVRIANLSDKLALEDVTFVSDERLIPKSILRHFQSRRPRDSNYLETI
jgi:hypothetical protein